MNNAVALATEAHELPSNTLDKTASSASIRTSTLQTLRGSETAAVAVTNLSDADSEDEPRNRQISSRTAVSSGHPAGALQSRVSRGASSAEATLVAAVSAIAAPLARR